MSMNNVNQGSLNNLVTGSLNNLNQGSMNNIAGGSVNNTRQSSSGEYKWRPDKPTFEGNLIQNFNENQKAIGAGITSLIGGVFGFDKEGREALGHILGAIQDKPGERKNLADALLSTYNLAVDDFGKMPLGEMVGNVITGAWKHPIDAAFDIAGIYGVVGKATGLSKAKNLKNLEKLADKDIPVKLAEEVTQENIRHQNLGNQFVKEIENIEKTYSPEMISKAMKSIEEVGIKNAPKELNPVINDLTRANDTYKMFTMMSGAEILDDVEFATRELIAKKYHVPFDQVNPEQLRKTKMWEAASNYVRENDVRPLFHLKPKLAEELETDKLSNELFKRKYGTIDYTEAPKNLTKKSIEFVNKAIQSNTIDSINRLNEKIEKFNQASGRNINKLTTDKNILGLKQLRELNSELKKNMLSAGVYLGANVITTTLSILNNFNLDAFTKTLKNLPKPTKVTLTEAKTPGLRLISRINNRWYQPIASIDKYLENIATEYASHFGPEKALLIQSAMPSKAVITNPALRTIKELVPFGSYPAAAVQEIGEHLKQVPGKALVYNQLNKLGQEVNMEAQQSLGIPVDRTKALRRDNEGNIIERNTVVTPIQAANMFLLGERGDAIQIPALNFVNNLINGTGDPTVFEVGNKKYRVENGIVKTQKGEFNLIPALRYATRNLLSPVRFYNDVLVPLMSDKYIRDENKLFNTMVNDAQYANLNSMNKQRVVTNAREKLGKKILGTYEYNYFNPDKFISKSVQRSVLMKKYQRDQMRDVLK